MKPNSGDVKLTNNIEQIVTLLGELVLTPRINAIKWSEITKQTANIKIGYPGQHLASLITGVEGERSGARGNDLSDGSEVKSCSRIDQLDKCNDCGAPVSRIEKNCSECKSENIKRNNDSKWLFGIRNQDELDLLTKKVKRVLLLLGDYPNFDEQDFETIRFQAYEIWPQSPRQAYFAEIMSNYYNKIYLEHKKQNIRSNPAPKNFWPFQYQFYLCNPILTFSCIVENANVSPKINIEKYIEPLDDRSSVESILMPIDILKNDEIDTLLNLLPEEVLKKNLVGYLDKNQVASMSYEEKRELFAEGVSEEMRAVLPLRDTDKISVAKSKYSRRGLE